ncbi:hypothetical protein KC354_g15184, partial [Hortaea werneckii]
MALAAGGTAPDRQPSPNRQTIAFSSNNPFRNRGTSPSPQSGAFPIAPPPLPQQQAHPPPRPSNMSKNPFLDASEMTSSPRKGSAPPTAGVTEDIFVSLPPSGVDSMSVSDTCRAAAAAAAAMQAFGADSMNMVLGGSGPLRSKLDLDKIHGTGVEGFTDYASTRKQDTNIVNPYERFEQVHGDATDGLGTSTFLEGAPASRRDQQRRESEDQDAMYAKASMAAGPSGGGNNGGGGGLTRKKSLAQRFRGMSNTRKVSGGNGGSGAGGLSLDRRSPEARYHNNTSSLLDNSPPRADLPPGGQKAVSAGGLTRASTRDNEINPFDKEYYDSAYEKKGAQIRIAEQSQQQERPSGGG